MSGDDTTVLPVNTHHGGGDADAMEFARKLLANRLSSGEDAGADDCNVLRHDDRIEGNGTTGGGSLSSESVNLVVDLNSCEGRKGFTLSVCAANDHGDSATGKGGDDEDGRKKMRKDGKFVASDLVWGKVRSHPWWPGQIFEPWDAREEAKKYFKADTYLVAYFGDQTFAWNEEVKLKPFWSCFSQMSKQSNAETFLTAVDCVLEEAYRRVEFALSCQCIADDTFRRIKTQVVENGGIRKESSVKEGGDRYYTAGSFEPLKFVPYVKALALLPDVELDKLEVVMARAVVSAFYRKKGYYNMAEFTVSAPLFENEADAPLVEGKSETLDADAQMLEHVSVDRIGRKKRQKRLADLMVEVGGKADGLSGSSTTKKRKLDEPMSVYLETKDKKRKKGSADLIAKDMERPLKDRETIGRIAKQLSRASKLGHGDNTSSSKRASKTAKAGSKKTQTTKVLDEEHSSPDEMLSQLQSAARDPLKRCSFLDVIVSFFSVFRNSVALEDQSHGDSAGEICNYISDKLLGPPDISEGAGVNISARKLKRKSSSKSERTGKSDNGFKDSFWTDRIIGSSEAQATPDNKNEAEAVSNGTESSGVPATSPDMLEGERTEGFSPTAMILNFSDPDSIPSEDRLNEIFLRYGPLLESETEVLRKSKRAKVVFMRNADAETAFSSSGKFKTFGPSLNSYRLNYKPVLPKNSSANSTHK